MSDKPELPADVSKLLDAAVGDLKPKGDTAQVVDIGKRRREAKGETWKDALATLKEIVAALESGEAVAIKRCAIIIQDVENDLDVLFCGPDADDLSMLALMGLAHHQIQSEMLY